MNEIADKANRFQMTMVSSPDMSAGRIAFCLGASAGLTSVWNWLSAQKGEEIDSKDILGCIDQHIKDVSRSAFSTTQVGENNLEEKKKLDFGKLSEYQSLAQHIKDRESKLDTGE